MKAVIQRCKSASVAVDGAVCGKIDRGLLVLVGVEKGDTAVTADLLAQKVADLRIFSDEQDKMNLSVRAVSGAALVISNFTLCACNKKGNRPSFDPAMPPEPARVLYQHFCNALREYGLPVKQGVFGADMEITLVGDGPVTILLDTALWHTGTTV